MGLRLRHRIPRPLLWAPLVLALGLALARWPLSRITALLIAGLGGPLLLLRPTWGLVPLLLSVPLARLGSLAVAGMRVSPAEAILAGILLAWLARMASHRKIRYPNAPLLLPFLLLLGAMLASLHGALSLTMALKELIKWGSMLAVYLFIVAHAERGQLGWVVGTILIAACGQALLGIYQFLTGRGPEWFLLFGRFMRAYGTFEQPNPYAGYLALSIPLAASLTVGLHTRLGRLAALGAFGLLCVALAMSWSRGAWLGVAMGLCTVGMVSSRRTALLTLTAIALLGLALSTPQLLPSAVTRRFGGMSAYLAVLDPVTAEVTDVNYALVERLAHWQAAINMWADHPWLGVGIGNYAAAYPAYALPHWPEHLGHAHNYYLNIGAEAGLVGLVCYTIFWISALWHTYRATQRTRGLPRAVALGVLGTLIGLSVHSVFDNLYVHTMYLQVAVLLGLISQQQAMQPSSWSLCPCDTSTGHICSH